MTLSKFTGATNTIQSLSDRPNQNEGLTAAQLKIKFDQFAIDSKAFYNDVVTVEIDASLLNANTNANNAVSTSNGANTKADNAISVASGANTKADNAVATANTASTNATTAVSTANSASSVANSANSTALAVQTDYDLVKPTLLQAVEDVALKVDKAYVDNLANNFTLGTIPDNTLTNAKMANEMKKSVAGGVASQNDLTSLTEVVNGHTSSLAESMNILTSTGTANEIILPVTLADKKKYSFKATDNSTSAVTINGVTFKKLDGTVIGNGGVKINKVYDFYFDSSANSVFILAKAEGDAVVGDVLATKIFSNGDDTGLIGTMIDRGTVNITPSTVNQPITGGKHSGSGVVYGDADLIAGNILSGKNIFGVDGSVVVGKKWASGTVTSSGTQETYHQPSSDVFAYSLIVSGLTFTPSVIVCTDAIYGLEFTTVDKGAAKHLGYTIISTGVAQIRLIAPAYINATSFKMPVTLASTSYRWIAFE